MFPVTESVVYNLIIVIVYLSNSVQQMKVNKIVESHQHSKNGKSPGKDNIVNELLKT